MEEITLRITVDVRNDDMMKRRKALGLSQRKLADKAGVELHLIARLEKLDYPDEFDWLDIGKIAEVLDLPTKKIMLPSVVVQNLLGFIERSERRLLLKSANEILQQTEMNGTVKNLMKTLSLRDREIVKLRYGIGKNELYTLEEIADIYKISRERVRQIVFEALLKLQKKAKSSMK